MKGKCHELDVPTDASDGNAAKPLDIATGAGRRDGVLCSSPITFRYLAAQQLRMTPYTLRLEAYDYQIGAEGRRFSTQTIARRSDRAMADSATSGILDHSDGLVLRKVTSPNGEIFSVADRVSAYVQCPSLTSEQLAAAKERLQNLPETCAFLPSDKVVEHGTILGHAVLAVSQSFGDERVTFWRAPSLSCQSLQTRTETRQLDGSYQLKAEGKAISLVIGEPDPALFEVPTTYASMRPSDLMHKEFDRTGAPWDDNTQHGADRADAQYSRQPASAPGSGR